MAKIILPSKEEHEAWLAHGVTRAVLKYLRDLALETREEWFNGESWTDQARWETAAYEDVVNLPYEKLDEHFNPPEKKEGTMDEDTSG
ncbi:MAG: hypothetical protein QF744_15025 [SAR202 cluster bacterium]|jgi:hypothetical protein|nr:hypothetical protein [SAR202 cluster bacterium]